MKLVRILLNRINGLYFPREYLCLANETFEQPLLVYLTDNNKILKDITQTHVFAGYHPLIFILQSATGRAMEFQDNIDVILSPVAMQPNVSLGEKDATASLRLKLFRKHTEGDRTLFFYEGIYGQHHFLSPFHQYIIDLNNQLFNKKTGNIFLPGNLYRQVQIAYSIPRIISLVTTGHAKLYNLFPSDLHGPIGDQYYIVSLRQGGKASQQVESSGKIVISTLHTDAFKKAYSLGKNHMQELKPEENFPFAKTTSAIFHLPLPNHALNYRELDLIASFDYGIHKLFLFKIVSMKVMLEEKSTLVHIHNTYATWRYNKGLPGNYLLR
ncbi:MAG TPA: flavin reductase [Chitinophagaceae bacterium]|nr:flavin reductase [Chitinophagaceae bacterium]